MSVSITKVVNLPQRLLKLPVQDENEDEQTEGTFRTCGGLFSNYAYLVNGSLLEVINSKTGNKMGAWTAGWALKDHNIKITCIKEIKRGSGKLPLLAVGLDCEPNGGLVCLFDFVRSRVLRAIQFDNKITSLHIVHSGSDSFTLPGPLRNFDGIVAVGTSGGSVFLVDLCQEICDEALCFSNITDLKDELNPCILTLLTSRDLDKIEHYKEFAIRNNQHLAIHINGNCNKVPKHFTLKGPKGEDRVHVNKDEVEISALYYCPQLGSLLIGYNFGAIQSYNLMNLSLIYTSPICDEHIPVSHFAVQEPADDPKAVCYIWAVYSSKSELPTQLPLAALYAFVYQSKEYHDGYGCIYQGFSSASVNFQMELTAPPQHRLDLRVKGGSCINLKSVIRKSSSQIRDEVNLSLCVFVWSVWFSGGEKDTFVALFDLNQWYKEQMPGVPRDQFCSTYMLHVCLTDLVNNSTNNGSPVLDACVDSSSIGQYMGVQKLEEHFFSNSLTFVMTCLRETDIIHLRNYGVQKALLVKIESSGSLCLVDPTEIYDEIISLGLLPLFIDLPTNTSISTNQQREVILSTALENHLIGWLCKCASEWANGSFLSTGCSLDFLVTWAFQRAVTLKTNSDDFCTPLFDYSGTRPDTNTMKLLKACTKQIRTLYSLYDFMVNKLLSFLSNPSVVIEHFKFLETVSVYFEVLQWFLNVGLLPECPISAYPRTDDMDRISAPYPAELLTEFYNHRRALLKIANEEKFSCSESALFIDALVEKKCGGKILQEQWRKDGGNGLYPPPSLQSLLRTYLIEGVDLSHKHLLVTYVFLDLAAALDQARYKPVVTYLIKFPTVFGVSASSIKIMQAFWQLDHCEFNTAMGLLLDPLVSINDLKSMHHKVALRALMLQNQHNYALLYFQIRNPILEDDDKLDVISLYLVNGMVDQAFGLLKSVNSKDVSRFLRHIFNECKKMGKLKSLIHRQFTPNEEQHFLKYLKEMNEPMGDDLNVYYHILRSRYIEAFDNHNRSANAQIANRGLLGQDSANSRELLVHSVNKMLPNVTRNIIDVCLSERNNVWNHVTKPRPISVTVHKLDSNIHTKSTYIAAMLAAAKQTFSSLDVSGKVATEETPFLRNPLLSSGVKRSASVLINSKITNFEESECSPKRPRLSISTLTTELSTPLVKRRTSKHRDSFENREVATPHSILKVKNRSMSRDNITFDDDFKEFKKIEYTPVIAKKKSPLGLSPRRSLVRFEGMSSLSSIENSGVSDKLSPVRKSERLSLNNSDARLSLSSSKNTSTEEFHSAEEASEDNIKTTETAIKEENKQKTNNVELEEQETLKPGRVWSPKGRRSYRSNTTPVRSSPRLSKTAEQSLKASFDKDLSPVCQNEEEKYSPSSAEETPESSSYPKVRSRRSLCRQVLETNAMSRLLNSSVSSDITQETTVEENKIVIESSKKFEDGEEKYTASIVTRHTVNSNFAISASEEREGEENVDQQNDLTFVDDIEKSATENYESDKIDKESVRQDEDKSANLEKSRVSPVDEDKSFEKEKSFKGKREEKNYEDKDSATKDSSLDSNTSSESSDDEEAMEVDDNKQNQDEKNEEIEEQTEETIVEHEVNICQTPEFEESSEETDKKEIEELLKICENEERNAEKIILEEVSAFEISDDLSFNAGFLVEEELVSEENIETEIVTEFEKNMNEDIHSDEDREAEESEKSDKNADEVIEIGSSSEEEDKSESSRSSSRISSSQSSEDSYEDHPHIYEDTRVPQQASSESEESEDEEKGNEERSYRCELFEGTIAFAQDEDQKENEKKASSSESSNSSEETEHEAQGKEEEEEIPSDNDKKKQDLEEAPKSPQIEENEEIPNDESENSRDSKEGPKLHQIEEKEENEEFENSRDSKEGPFSTRHIYEDTRINLSVSFENEQRENEDTRTEESSGNENQLFEGTLMFTRDDEELNQKTLSGDDEASLEMEELSYSEKETIEVKGGTVEKNDEVKENYVEDEEAVKRLIRGKKAVSFKMKKEESLQTKEKSKEKDDKVKKEILEDQSVKNEEREKRRLKDNKETLKMLKETLEVKEKESRRAKSEEPRTSREKPENKESEKTNTRVLRNRTVSTEERQEEKEDTKKPARSVRARTVSTEEKEEKEKKPARNIRARTVSTEEKEETKKPVRSLRARTVSTEEKEEKEKKPRSLRARTVSTEEKQLPSLKMRKRSASVDDVPTKSNPRNKKALEKIPEEEVLEEYSTSRRVTRKQAALLKNKDVSGLEVQPVVILENITESKVEDSSSEASSSVTKSSGTRASSRNRRLRSSSCEPDDSNLSDSGPSKRKRAKILPDIQEGVSKSAVVKRRARKNSSQS